MKLLTKQLENRFIEIGSQENVTDPIVVCKFFNPTGPDTWLATEYFPEEKMFFGWVFIREWEAGYFSLEELESLELPHRMKVERDLYCGEPRLSEYLGKQCY